MKTCLAYFTIGLLHLFSGGSGVKNKSRVRRGNVMSDEQRLYQRLMRRYEKSIRPVINATTPVVVRLGITLTQIFDVDERNQVLTMNVWLDQEWDDEKLIWEPHKYSGIEMLRLPCDSLWLPDIVLYNSVDDYTKGYMRSLAMVSHLGHVFWPPIVRFRSACKIDITYFPFDDQLCHLKLGSWAYDGFQVDVTNRTDNIDISNYIDNGEWELIESRVQRRVKKYACCPEPFPDVIFYLHLRRRTTYYTFNIIVPCVILSILTLGSFFLPSVCGEKVTLGLTVLLAFSVFMLLIAESMPTTSEFVPLIGIYLTLTMAMTSMSVIFSVFILHVHHRGSLTRRAPQWLRTLTLKLAKGFCVQPSPFLAGFPGQDNEPDENGCRKSSFYGSYNHGFRTSSMRSVRLTALETGEYIIQNNLQKTDSKKRIRSMDDEILQHLRHVVAKQEYEDIQLHLRKEWEDIALVLDRMLFWLFFLLGTSATLSLLVFKPMTKSLDIDDYRIES